MSTMREIAGRGIVRGSAAGNALVSPEPISFLGDLDIRTGEVVNRGLAISGQCVTGKVLVIPHSIGSAGAWRFLYQMFVHRTHPVAIVQRALPDSSLVQGAILAGIPIACDPDVDLLSAIATGDRVEIDVDPSGARLRVMPPADETTDRRAQGIGST